MLSQFDDRENLSISTELLFGGDFCPIGAYEKKILANENIFDDELICLFATTFSIINLEAPLCEKNIPADNPGGFGLRGDPRTAAYLKSLGVDIAGFANNHTRDFGDEGVYQTLLNLKKSNILATGAGKNIDEANKILRVEVNGLKLGIWALAEKELNIATETTAGSSWFNLERNLPDLEKRKGEFDFIIIYLHAGHEFISTPSPRIRDACRAFVDAGADAVIAHHPHVIQGVEKYKNALIAYSLGNLVFDSPYVSAYEDTDLGYLVKLGISKHAIVAAELIPYKLRKNAVVSSLDDAEFYDFEKRINRLSENITDDRKFIEQWEKNVTFRYETEYRQVLNDFSKNMNDPDNLDYARRSRNLFACPTHVEMIEKIFLMHETGQLKRGK